MHSMTIDRMARAAVIALLVAGAGCGGGGGGGGGAQGAFRLSTSDITFTAASPSAAPPKTQYLTGTVSGTLAGTLYILIANSNPAVATVGPVMLGGTSGEASVSPAPPSSLGVGVFKSTLTVRACMNDRTCATGELSGSPATIAITYTISGVAATASSLSYAIGNTPTAADGSRTVTVTGAPSQSWAAQTDVPWLSLAPSTGRTDASVDLAATLVQGQVDTMTNGTYRGSVTITPQAGPAIVLPVTLAISRTEVQQVSPHVVSAETPAEVVIRGEHLSQIDVTSVRFGANARATPHVVSDTEIRATCPGLAAGTYPVALENPQGFTRSLASLVAVAPPAYAASALAYPTTPSAGSVLDLVYDAERAALIVARYPDVLLRYAYVNGAWATPTTASVPSLTSLGLSTNGQWLLAGTGGRSSGGTSIKAGITSVTPDTLVVGATAQSNMDPGSGITLGTPLATSDGTVLSLPMAWGLLATALRFDSRDSSVAGVGDPGWGGAGVSGDGTRVVVGGDGGQVIVYDAGTATATTASVAFPRVCRAPPALDRSGSRVILNDGDAPIGGGMVRVFDGATFTALGDLPATTLLAVLSPDGTRAYAYDAGGKLRTFDLSGTPPGVGVRFPEIGTGTTLAGSPGGANTQVGLGLRMIISPDGGTIFLAGADRIVVQPVP